MRILSLFDGMACGMLAMQAAGVSVDKYVAYEIDKYAVQTSSHNFPMIEHRGDVFQADFTEFSGYDFVLAGFPCTKFSIAQKNDRETQPYSGEGWLLFEQAWRAVCEAKPQYFIFENNKSMAKPVQREISKIVGFEPICINSALVSAQNRQRLYWVGKRNLDGTYSKVHVDQPEDRGISIRDVLVCEPFGEIKGKAYALTATYWKGNPKNKILEKSQRTHVAEPVAINTTADGEKARTLMACYYKYGTETLITNEGFAGGTTAVSEPIRIPEYGTEDKARPLGANYSNNCGGFEHRMFSDNPNKQQVDMVAVPICMRYERSDEAKAARKKYEAGEIRHGFHELHELHPRNDGKTNTLSTVLKDNPICCSAEFPFAVHVEWDENGKPTKAISCSDGKVYPVYEVKDGKITIKGKQYPIKLVDGFYIIRKLTVSECKRLQTVPEWYEFPVSDTQAYKMLGNGWTVLIISHLILATQCV